MPDPECPYVSRGGLKLEHALREWSLDPTGMVCADLGASTGGFTDCLLKHGAARVYAVDTAYGQLAWSLRKDARVVVMERSNALHTKPPESVWPPKGVGPGEGGGGVDLVVMDLGWTRQRFAIPAALMWLGAHGRIVTLVKPHYEQEREQRADAAPRGRGGRDRGGRGESVLEESDALAIVERIRGEMPAMGVRVLGVTRSPILGGSLSPRAKTKGSGNAEWLMLVGRSDGVTE